MSKSQNNRKRISLSFLGREKYRSFGDIAQNLPSELFIIFFFIYDFLFIHHEFVPKSLHFFMTYFNYSFLTWLRLKFIHKTTNICVGILEKCLLESCDRSILMSIIRSLRTEFDGELGNYKYKFQVEHVNSIYHGHYQRWQMLKKHVRISVVNDQMK